MLLLLFHCMVMQVRATKKEIMLFNLEKVSFIVPKKGNAKEC